MAIEFRCGNCDSRLKVPDDSGGKRVKCPKCESIQTIPGSSQPATAALAKTTRITPVSAPAGSLSSATAKSKPVPSPAKPVRTQQLPPLESPSPFASLGSFLEDELTAGPPAKVENTAREAPDPNPYASPTTIGRTLDSRQGGGSRFLGALAIPAAFLMILSAIFVVLYTVSVPKTITRYANNRRIPIDRLFEDPRDTGFVAGVIVGSLVIVAVNIAIFCGALCMISGKKHSLAKTSAIWACVPLCNIFTLPFGIWALIVLSKDAVKRSFRS